MLNWKAIAPLCLPPLLALALPSAALADPDALSKIVIGKCVPAEQQGNTPGPCKLVDLAGRYAMLKDLVGKTQYLLIPTDKVEGIEAPEIEQANAPDYFEDAWEARRFMDESLGKPIPRDDVGLAINSTKGRSQNQFHIHIDCVRPDVLKTLAGDEAKIGTHWAPLPTPLLGHPYLAMRVEAPDLTKTNPFALLASQVPDAGKDMGDETLVAVATTFSDKQDGFYLLSDRVDLIHADVASGEELLDHSCTVLAP